MKPFDLRRAAVALFAVAALAGCAKSGKTGTSTPTSTISGIVDGKAILAQSSIGGDRTHGEAIFAQNCASCHGAVGTEGGVGPSLRDEKKRKNMASAIAWIKNPQYPMPKLYPDPLSAKDVADVAAYVESL